MSSSTSTALTFCSSTSSFTFQPVHETKRVSFSSTEGVYASRPSVNRIPSPTIVSVSSGTSSTPSSLDPTRVQSLSSEGSRSRTSSSSTSDSDSVTGSPASPASPISIPSTRRSPSLDSLILPRTSSSSSSSSTDSPLSSRSSSSSLSSTSSPLSSRNSSASSTPTSRRYKSLTLTRSLSFRHLADNPEMLAKIPYAAAGVPSPSGNFIDGPAPLAPLLGPRESIVLRSGPVNLHIVTSPVAVPYRNGQQTPLPAINEGKEVRSSEVSITSSSNVIPASLQKLYNAETKSVGNVEVERHTPYTPLNTWKRLLSMCTPLSKDALDEIEAQTDFFRQLLDQPQMPIELSRNDNAKRLLSQTGFFTIISNIASEEVATDAEAQLIPTIQEKLERAIDSQVKAVILKGDLQSIILRQLDVASWEMNAIGGNEKQLANAFQRKLAATIREVIVAALETTGKKIKPEDIYILDLLEENQAINNLALATQELITTTIQEELAEIKAKRSNAILRKLINPSNIQQQKDIVRTLVEAATIANREAETTTTNIVIAIPTNVHMGTLLEATKDTEKFEVAGLTRYHAWTSYARLKEEFEHLEADLRELQELRYTRSEAIEQIRARPGKVLKSAQIKQKLDQDKPPILPPPAPTSFIGKIKKLVATEQRVEAIEEPKEFSLVDIERLTLWLQRGNVLPIDIFNYYKRQIEHTAREKNISQEAVEIVEETILPNAVYKRAITELFAKHPIVRDAIILKDFIERMKSHFTHVDIAEENPQEKTKFSYAEMIAFAESYLLEKFPPKAQEAEDLPRLEAEITEVVVRSKAEEAEEAEEAEKARVAREEDAKILCSILLGVLGDWGSEGVSADDARKLLVDYIHKETALVIGGMKSSEQEIVNDLIGHASTMCARILNDDQRHEIQKRGHLDREPTVNEKMVGDNAFKIPPPPQDNI